MKQAWRFLQHSYVLTEINLKKAVIEGVKVSQDICEGCDGYDREYAHGQLQAIWLGRGEEDAKESHVAKTL